MAKFIRAPALKKTGKGELTPLQQTLLNGPTMTAGQYKEFLKNNKWMRKWKA